MVYTPFRKIFGNHTSKHKEYTIHLSTAVFPNFPPEYTISYKIPGTYETFW
jgi:hypothetical protein